MRFFGLPLSQPFISCPRTNCFFYFFSVKMSRGKKKSCYAEYVFSIFLADHLLFFFINFVYFISNLAVMTKWKNLLKYHTSKICLDNDAIKNFFDLNANWIIIIFTWLKSLTNECKHTCLHNNRFFLSCHRSSKWCIWISFGFIRIYLKI